MFVFIGQPDRAIASESPSEIWERSASLFKVRISFHLILANCNPWKKMVNEEQ